jgi:hypothetical protein
MLPCTTNQLQLKLTTLKLATMKQALAGWDNHSYQNECMSKQSPPSGCS